MKKRVFSAFVLALSLNSAAYARMTLLTTELTGTATASDHSSIDVGKTFQLNTAMFFDTDSIEVSYASNGERIEQIRGRSSAAISNDSGNGMFYGGYLATITARFHEIKNGSTQRSVDLIFNGVTDYMPLYDLNYHIPLVGDNYSLAELIKPGQSLDFGPTTGATAEWISYEYNSAESHWYVHGTAQMNLFTGRIIALPEPSTYMMLGAGFGIFAFARRGRYTLTSVGAA